MNGLSIPFMRSGVAARPDATMPLYINGSMPINEEVYTNPNGSIDAYTKSKILAELAAWNFVQEKKNKTGKCFDLAVINPGFVFGPTFHKDLKSTGTSEKFLESILSVSPPRRPDQFFVLCDVRGYLI